MTTPLRIAQIGFGGIGLTVAGMLADDPNFEYVAAVARPHRLDALQGLIEPSLIVESPSALLAAKPDLVIECASHGALIEYAEPVLGAGVDLIAVSVGALVDESFRTMAFDTAKASGASIDIPSGAIGGLDVITAARHAGITRLTYVTRKAPRLWKGTPAEKMLDLDAVVEPVMFFDETAAVGGGIFQEKLNVATTLALAGVGFEDTRVQLWADPAYVKSTHQIQLEAKTGTMTIELANTVTPVDNTASWLTSCSIVQSVKNRRAILRF
jgi:aspartate dehydrogenase